MGAADRGAGVDADRLLDEAAATPFTGWDFSWLGDRLVTTGPSWSFDDIVCRLASSASSMLDMGTGGGEWLRSLGSLPARCVATESWPPNAPVAAAALRPVGVPVVQDEGAPDNLDQPQQPGRGRLAFRDGAFDLVTNRHEAFVAAEVRRVLADGGRFVTQQADSGGAAFHALLGLEGDPPPVLPLSFVVDQVRAAGLVVDDAGEEVVTHRFADVGALAWYLAAVPWCVPGFTIAAFRDQLLGLDGADLVVQAPRFWLVARSTG